ncbi:MAG TPA: aminopeptidase P family N-terminal domain-containing protein, partial [Candidatus Limnocylindria bacterium]|nr:aminopeptidase P family N-terminal domain-containing protein [Candidatus Limnocylindria bacterium]
MLLNEPRAQALMEQHQVAALVATAAENVTYTSGYWAMSQWIRRGPQAYAVHPAAGHGAPCIIASTGALDLVADQDPPVKEVHRYGFFALEVEAEATLEARDARLRELAGTDDEGDPVTALVSVLRARGLDRERVGIDEYGIPPPYLTRLREALP